mmetsp:Transcript_79344/g.190444  ORF Transcript_79344/g.190444 Transcript_79344/m.190444 type:complete len:206 (-) Transcript_79344:200-817(-)
MRAAWSGSGTTAALWTTMTTMGTRRWSRSACSPLCNSTSGWPLHRCPLPSSLCRSRRCQLPRPPRPWWRNCRRSDGRSRSARLWPRWWTTTSPSPTRKKRTPWRSITPVCRRGRGAPMPRSARAGRWIATAQGLCAGARRRSGKRMGIVCAPLRLFTDAGSVHTMLGKRGRGRSAARRYAGCESFANGSWTWHSRLSKANRLHPF